MNPQDLSVEVAWANWHQWRAGQTVEQNAQTGYSFWLVREGKVTVESRYGTLLLEEGAGFLWPPNCQRRVCALEPAVWLSVGLRAQAFGHLNLLEQLQPPRSWIVPPGERDELDTWLRRLVQHRRPTSTAEAVLADGVARALVATIWSSLSREDLAQALQRANPPWVNAVLQYTREHPGARVEDLASAAHLSPEHLRREFKRLWGQAPHQWLATRRLENARHLLETTTLPVKEVARRCGYSSPSHFAAIFRAHTGQTPEALRLALRKQGTGRGASGNAAGRPGP